MNYAEAYEEKRMNKDELLIKFHKADPLAHIIIPFLFSYPNLFFLTKFGITTFSLLTKQLSCYLLRDCHCHMAASFHHQHNPNT